MFRKKRWLLATLFSMGLTFGVSGQPASAITYGELDGGHHPNVGALIVQINDTKRPICTGTLIDQNTFLTASHCTTILPAESTVWVSFDQDVFDEVNRTIEDNITLYEGKTFTNPSFSQRQSDTGDIAVVELEAPVTGITPAKLPRHGLLDELARTGELRGQTFTAVGYGSQEPQNQPGGPVMDFDGQRRVAYSSFNALNKTWLRLSQNAATGDSGTCYGDSGGPNFLGKTNIIAGITVTGDAMCKATNTTYRLDTPSAQNFLGNYVNLDGLQ